MNAKCNICTWFGTTPLSKHITSVDDELHNTFIEDLIRKYEKDKMSPDMIATSLKATIALVRAILKIKNIRIRGHIEAVANSVIQNRQNICGYGNGGFREDLNNELYRSSPEANFARILKFRKIEFEHEVPFDIKDENGKTICTYFLDFLVQKKQGFEVKGYQEETGEFKNRKKITLFTKQYPEIKLKVIFCNKQEWAELVLKYSKIVPFWEELK